VSTAVKLFDKTFAGRYFDTAFLNDLPRDVDPCGENGEFHTFVFDGPLFRKKIPFRRGNMVLEDNRFYLLNLF
jgi:diphthamide synthase (EF-2-diphthine--ammonia ligase)